MATYQVPTPNPVEIKGDQAQNWKEFEESWNDYIIATELKDKDKSIQVAALRRCMGEECRKRLGNIKLTEDQKKDPALVLGALREKFTPSRNIIYDRYNFFKTEQFGAETIDEYVHRLRSLAEPCKFGELEDELVRDMLVIGTKDKASRGKIFRQDECDLKSAIKTLQINEQTNSRLKNMAKGDESVHYTQSQGPSQGQRHNPRRQKSRNTAAQPHKKKEQESMIINCNRCGRNHGLRACPAYGQKCTACSGLNHYASHCKQKKQFKRKKQYAKKKKVHQLDTESTSDEQSSSEAEDIHTLSTEIEHINTVENSKNKLFAMFDIVKKDNNKRQKFQLDSGATCNVLNSSNVPASKKLKKTKKILVMYNKTKIKPLGQIKIRINNPKNGRRYRICFLVVPDGVSNPLLGWSAMKQMQLVTVNEQNVMLAEETQSIINHENVMLADTEVKPLTIGQLEQEFPEVFKGLGKLQGQYNIEIDPDVTPVVHAPRKVPVALKSKLKTELKRLENEDIITQIKDEATPWVNSIVIVDKPNKTRICLDPKDLNRAIKRRHYPMPTIDDILPELHDAKIFSVMDAKDGFCQVELTEESSKLTTFNTPYGRYRWKRMPFGLKSSPEEYQRRQDQVLEGLEGVRAVADDILIVGQGSTTEEAIENHNENLRNLMKRCQEKNLKLNKDKARLAMTEVKFIGHLLTDQGLKPDKDKVEAVLQMPKPENVTGVRRIIGFVNYLARFLPRLSDLCEPLRKLILKETAWHWTEEHDQAMDAIKKAVTEHPILSYYKPDEELTLQTDASETGLGCALIQHGQPIAYASRALLDTETRYAQIEKELLAVVWGLERFHQYTYGRPVLVQSDHKPLEIITRKPLYKAPKRLQTLLLRLQKYETEVTYHPGKHMYLADTLSRAYLPQIDSTVVEDDHDTASVNMLQSLRVAEPRLDEIRIHTKKDESMQQLKEVILKGWPERKADVPNAAAPYFMIRDELSVEDDIICRGERVVIPPTLRKDMMTRIHSSHMGVESCLRRAREILHWPNMNAEVKDFIENCEACRTYETKQSKETLQSHDVPDRPWSKVGTDLFTCNGYDYLLTVDYYSDFFEVDFLEDTTSKTVIHKLKAHFSRHGIPDELISDNAKQYVSEEFERFSRKWMFKHTTSSPLYPQSNGKAEASVKIAKNLMRKAKASKSDAYLALLEYRNTPTKDMDTSPVQRLMNRQTQSVLPTRPKLLQPKLNENVNKQRQHKQQKQAQYYNKSAKDLPELQQGDVVRVQPGKYIKTWSKAVVQRKVAPRSYEVITEAGVTLRRNRRHLKSSKEQYHQQDQEVSDDDMPEQPQPAQQEHHAAPQQQEQRPQAPARTRAGRSIRKPSYLRDYVTA